MLRARQGQSAPYGARISAARSPPGRCLNSASTACSQVGESSLYPALQRLLLKGWVKAEWGASDNNRRARFYTLTAAGRKQLAVERHEFNRLIAAIQKVLNTA